MSYKLKSCGIHTRLNFIIEKSGGLNKECRKNFLMKDFNLSEEDVVIVLEYPYEDWIKEMSYEEIMELIMDDIEIKEKNKMLSVHKFHYYINGLLNMYRRNR